MNAAGSSTASVQLEMWPGLTAGPRRRQPRPREACPYCGRTVSVILLRPQRHKDPTRATRRWNGHNCPHGCWCLGYPNGCETCREKSGPANDIESKP